MTNMTLYNIMLYNSKKLYRDRFTTAVRVVSNTSLRLLFDLIFLGGALVG